MFESDLKYSKSISLHVALVAAMFAFTLLKSITPGTAPKIQPKKVYIKQAIRVDVVGMPKHTLKELKAMKVQPVQPKVEPKPAVKVDPIKTAPSESDFIKSKKKASFKDMIKNLSKKKVDRPKVKGVKKGSLKNSKAGKGNSSLIDERKLNKLILEGNKISKGNSLTGVEVAQKDYGAFENYIQALPDHIRPYWKLPSYLLNKDFKCRIQVYINGSGELVRLSLVESSNDSEYDSKALQAVKDAAPFPRPDGSIVSLLIQGEVILGFPL